MLPGSTSQASGRACRSCGYSLRGLRAGRRCPECGTRNRLTEPLREYWPADAPLPLGLLSIVLSAARFEEGVFNSAVLGLVPGVLGVYMGVRALRLVKSGEIAADFHKNAQMGLVLSCVGTGLSTISLIALIIALL